MFGLTEFLQSNVNLTSFLIGLIVFLIVGYIVSTRERAGIPPGPPFLPLLGNLLDMRGKYVGKKHIYFDDMQAKYGSVFRIYFGKQLLIVLCDTESVNEAFIKQKELFSTRPADKFWDVVQSNKLPGMGIIWSSGQHWKNIRRTTIQTLRDLGVGKATLEERIKDETSYILDAFREAEEQPINQLNVLMKATSNIISSIVFGSRFDYNDPVFLTLLKFTKTAFEGEGPLTPINVVPQIRFLPFLQSKRKEIMSGFLQFLDYITKIINEHKETLNKDNPRDFIDVYLTSNDDEDFNTISHGTLQKTILDLFLAGTDTTANTLDWAFLYLILNPNIQNKCQDEIDSVVGSSRMVDWADRRNMPYIEATLLETQRLANVTPITLPHTTTQDTTVKGFLIPEGSLVFGHLRACHLDKNCWENPLIFNPDRWMSKDGKSTKDPNFFPFSLGSRICPGEALAKMEMFLIFTNILQRFTLFKIATDNLTVEGIFGITMSTEPYFLQVKSR